MGSGDTASGPRETESGVLGLGCQVRRLSEITTGERAAVDAAARGARDPVFAGVPMLWCSRHQATSRSAQSGTASALRECSSSAQQLKNEFRGSITVDRRRTAAHAA